MDPLISLQLEPTRRFHHPGDLLAVEYQIDAVDPGEIAAVEVSVLWYTEGKGDEDLSAHFFQRRVPSDNEEGDLRRLHRIQTVLPNSPLSYAGEIVKIRWCARIRVFLRGGKEALLEQPFVLTSPSPQPIAPP
jgi:hypothetical protein